MDDREIIVQFEFEDYQSYLEKQDFTKDKDVKYIMELLKHSCTWKGGKDVPNCRTLQSICDLKKISYLTGDNKFIIFRKLISKLRQELFTIDSNCVCPLPKTDAAKLLFKGELDTKIRVFTHQETSV